MKFSAILSVAILASAACADSSGEVQGGGLLYDAQPQPGAPSTACGTTITWTSLYKDYFGPGSKGHCSGGTGDEAQCHLRPDSVGVSASLEHWLCGATKDECYAGFKTLVPPMNGYAHYYQQVLRQDGPPTGKTPMPMRPSVTFTSCDFDRLNRWAAVGANND